MNITAQLIQRKKKTILESWISNQLSGHGLHDDLISNEELHKQSEELLDELGKAMASGNADNIYALEYEPVTEILSDISITRARQGFSPRETGLYVLSLKQALAETLEQQLADQPDQLYKEMMTVNRLLDDLSIITFETFIKGREEVILRQTR